MDISRVITNLRAKDPSATINLRKCQLRGSDLTHLHLWNIDISGANLVHADLTQSWIRRSIGKCARMEGSNLSGVRILDTQLDGTSFRYAGLAGCVFQRTSLRGCNFQGAHALDTAFIECDMSECSGLNAMQPESRVSIDNHTIRISHPVLPGRFLEMSGITSMAASRIRSALRHTDGSPFIFISYAHEDMNNVNLIRAGLQSLGAIVFNDKNIRGGRPLTQALTHAISRSDAFVLVLSENTTKSNWIRNEVRLAMSIAREAHSKCRIVPARLCPLEMLDKWVFVDAKSGMDIAEEIRSLVAIDFSGIKGESDAKIRCEILLDSINSPIDEPYDDTLL